jgi:hypothetical protein
LDAETLIVEDLSESPGDPLERRQRVEHRVAASRGLDVTVLAPTFWPVCSLCNRPSVSMFIGLSACCRGPIRVQGWAP